jgi:hypothetical protein
MKRLKLNKTRQECFLRALADTGNVSTAVAVAGTSRSRVYELGLIPGATCSRIFCWRTRKPARERLTLIRIFVGRPGSTLIEEVRFAGCSPRKGDGFRTLGPQCEPDFRLLCRSRRAPRGTAEATNQQPRRHPAPP